MSGFLSQNATYLGWFTKPISLETATKTHTLSVSSTGDIQVTQLDRATGAVVTTTLEVAWEIDDHAAFGLERLSDDKIIAFWGHHNIGAKALIYAISTNPDDSTAWGAPATMLAAGAWTYTNIFNLSAEGGATGRYYVFIRDQSVGVRMSYFFSDDDFATISGPFPILVCTSSANYPYTVFSSNKVDRIDFATTVVDVSTSPPLPDESRLSVRHAYFMAEQVFASDGTFLGSRAGGDFPLTVETSMTMVYDSAVSGIDTWVWDIVTNGGLPSIAFVRFDDLGTGNIDQKYCESTWSGSAWPVETVIATAGGPPDLNTNDRHYSMGICFIGDDPATVYAGCGTYLGSRMIRGTKSAGVWTETEIIGGANNCRQVNLRPFVPRPYGATVSPLCRLVYCDGSYAGFNAYNTSLRFVSDVAGMAAGGWSLYAEATVNHGQVVTGPHGDFTGIITQAELPADFWANVQADGGDIRFSLGATATGGGEYTATNVLPCQIVAFDQANQLCEIWVNHPEVDSVADRAVIMWYGGSGKTAPLAALGLDADGFPGSQAVWHLKVLTGVYHFNEASGGLVDSTVNANDFGTVNGTPTYAQAGMFGTSLSAIKLPNDTASFDAGKLVGMGFEAWFDPLNANASHSTWIVGHAVATSDSGYAYTIADAGTPRRVRAGTSGGQVADSTVPTGWVFVSSQPLGIATVFTQSIKVNARAAVTSAAVTAPGVNRTRIGGLNRLTSLQLADAIVDEIRLFVQATTSAQGGRRTNAYHETEYNNGTAPGTFWTFGAPVPIGGGGSVAFARAMRGGPGRPSRGRPGFGGTL